MALLAGLIFGCLCMYLGINRYEQNKKISQIYITLGIIFFCGGIFFFLSAAGLVFNQMYSVIFGIVIAITGTRNISVSLNQSIENKHRVLIY